MERLTGLMQVLSAHPASVRLYPLPVPRRRKAVSSLRRRKAEYGYRNKIWKDSCNIGARREKDKCIGTVISFKGSFK